MYDRIYNFSSGPATLPVEVLERARDGLLNYGNSGMSVMEMSHRSKAFMGTLDKAETGVRETLGVPDTHEVLFLQGGASMQFAMIPMNLYLEGKPVDMIHTGVWTKKAIGELKKLAEHRIAGSAEDSKFTRVPRQDELDLSPDASYVHMATNNTIYGTQYKYLPETGDVPLVSDMSSDIMSKPVDVGKHGMIFAGAQKNIGPSGVALIIIRKDLAERCKEEVPTMFQYRSHIDAGSMYNTPPTFGIYMISLVMEWVKENGGLTEMEKFNEDKAGLLYDAIDNSKMFYGPVGKEDRSLMNVVFRVEGDNEELEAQFVSEAKDEGLVTLKGHRSVGGLRASIYNAMPKSGVEALVDFMGKFEKANS